jgi:hypothetical protein
MSKRLSRVVAPLVTALIVGACVASWVGGSTNYMSEKSDQNPSIAVSGDSNSYTLYNALLPCPRHDTTGTAGDLYQADCAETLVFNVGSCDKIAVFGRWDGDSVAYWIDYSFDGQTWTNYLDSTFVNGTPSRTWTPVRSDGAQKVWTQLDHFESTLATTAAPDTVLDSFLWRSMRIRMLNMDSDSAYVDSAGAGQTAEYIYNTAADTVINIEWTVQCRE